MNLLRKCLNKLWERNILLVSMTKLSMQPPTKGIQAILTKNKGMIITNCDGVHMMLEINKNNKWVGPIAYRLEKCHRFWCHKFVTLFSKAKLTILSPTKGIQVTFTK